MNKFIIADGAMGLNLLNRAGLRTGNYLPDDFNLSQPELVLNLHKEYVSAGAEILRTNTFSGRCVAEGCALAKKAAGNEAKVWGALGPLAENFADSIDIFLDFGINHLHLETFFEPTKLADALEIAIAKNIELSVSLFCDKSSLKPLPELLRIAQQSGINQLGLNCMDISDINYLLSTTGLTSISGNFMIFPSSNQSAESWAQALKQISKNGQIKIIGGCCGTTPEHISVLKKIS